MTRETKIGMLVGMGVIVLIGILISDHLSLAQQQDEAHLLGGQAAAEQPRHQANPPSLQRTDPLPLPQSAGAAERATPSAPNGNPAPVPTDPSMTPQVRHRLYPAAVQNEQLPDDNVAPLGQAHRASDPVVDELTMGQAVEPAAGDSTQAMDQPSAVGDRVHHVQAGQTLFEIAKQYYDDGNYWRTIYEANREKMTSPTQLRKGVRLVIPNRAGQVDRAASPAGSGSRPTATAPASRYTTHKVAKGETLSEIAQRYFGTVRKLDELIALNDEVIDDPNRVPAGVMLRVPTAGR